MARATEDEIEYQSYLFSMKRWELDYRFGLGDHLINPIAYREHLALLLTAVGEAPKRVADRTFSFYFIGDRTLDASLETSEPLHYTPTAVGMLRSRGDRQEFLGSLPLTTMLGLMPAIESGRSKSILMHGHAMKYGRASITYVSFASAHDPDDV